MDREREREKKERERERGERERESEEDIGNKTRGTAVHLPCIHCRLM